MFSEWHNDKDVVVYAAPLVPADYECRPIFFFFNGDGGSGIDFKDLLRMCSCSCHQSANAWLISVHYV